MTHSEPRGPQGSNDPLSSGPNDYRYHPLPDDGSYIRLVSIYPGSYKDDIVISMTHCNFLENPATAYECLSYSWGSKAQDSETIMVRPWFTEESCRSETQPYCPYEMIRVTETLASALRDLRRSEEVRVMWIDALCIEQSNNHEKSRQVQLMGKVYQHASRVVVWLGPMTDDSRRAFDLLHDLSAQVEMTSAGVDPCASVKPSPTSKDPDLALLSSPLPFDGEDLRSIHHLLYRSWFERLWIRQEIFLSSPSAIITCGACEMAWSTFKGLMGLMTRKGWRRFDLDQELRDRLRMIGAIVYQNPTVSFTGLRQEFRGSLCSEPKDRIYAILALLNDSEKNLGIQVDYDRSMMEISEGIIRRYVEGIGSLDFLRQCELQEPTTRPSWVPQWAESSFVSHAIGSYSSPSLGAWYRFLDGQEGVLQVAGVAVSVVTGSQAVLTPEARRTGDRYQLFETLKSILFGKDLNGSYSGGGTLNEAYVRTLLADQIGDFYQPSLSYRPDLQSSLGFLQQIIAGNSGYDPEMFGRGTPASKFLETVFDYAASWNILSSTSGLIGLVPPVAREGDIVCVLLGCDFPVLLRPTEQGRKFLVVGQCFVSGYGVSQGDALLGPLPKNVRMLWVLENGYYPSFVDELTGQVLEQDPRLQALPIDVKEHCKRPSGNPFDLVFVDPEILRQQGREIQYFDLI